MNLNFKNKRILCLDGGGMKGILTIQLLKKLEEVVGQPCYEIFNLIAGTSTGGIIAGLIGAGKTATEIDSLYQTLIHRVFKKRDFISGRFVELPKYTKDNYISDLFTYIGNLKIGDCKTDILITAKNITSDEEITFDKDSLLKTAMEATMSAPTYFAPLVKGESIYVDGGTTTYNNPSLLALSEVLERGWNLSDITLMSFGTGYSPNQPTHYKDNILFWINYIMEAAREDASYMQMRLLRNLPLDLRRYNVKIPNDIQMDDVSQFDLMKNLGEQFASTIDFTKDSKEARYE